MRQSAIDAPDPVPNRVVLTGFSGEPSKRIHLHKIQQDSGWEHQFTLFMFFPRFNHAIRYSGLSAHP
jgi:hypothetical protein